MPVSYPPAVPTLTGSNITIDRFLQFPEFVQRQLRTIAQQRFIGDVILSSRFPSMGGAVLYEQSETIFADKNAQAVAPGSEFPLASTSRGTALMASVTKWGLDSPISDEAVRRLNFDPIARASTKLINSVVQKVDTVALAAVAAAVTQTQAVGTAWSSSTAILRDILTAVATINALNQGYNPDTLVVNDITAARLASDPTITTALRREDGRAPVYTGYIGTIGGLDVLRTPNLPVASTAWVLDRTMLGAMVEEEPLTFRSFRQDTGPQITEGWLLRAKRTVVPIVIEPNAAVKLTGV